MLRGCRVERPTYLTDRSWTRRLSTVSCFGTLSNEHELIDSVSIHKSNFIINHWTNGDRGFTQGPPASDVNMKGKLDSGDIGLQLIVCSEKHHDVLPDRRRECVPGRLLGAGRLCGVDLRGQLTDNVWDFCMNVR